MKKSIRDLIDTYIQINKTVQDLTNIMKKDETTGEVSDICDTAVDLLLDFKEMLGARVVEV